MGIVLAYKTRTLALLEEVYGSNEQIVKYLHSQVTPNWEKPSESLLVSFVARHDEEKSL